ncbi:MAG: MFS transporter [Flavobacteriales bacterium]|nr:MAG: MFS transporter [Flavobacteriales bacterium TMED96]RZP11895.1 MAG: MFS transporter [Flavobacteriales bacterium]
MRSKFLVGIILFVFFVISFLTNIIGPLVPDIISAFNLSLSMAAFLPFSFFLAYGFMSIPSGFLVEYIGEKKVMILAFLISSIGALAFSINPSYSLYVLSLFLIGSGMAMLQVSINPLLRNIGGEKEFAFNSVLGQLFFGLASFISPLIYSYLIISLSVGNEPSNNIILFFKKITFPNLRWVSLYWIFSLVSFLMCVTLIFTNFPEKKKPIRENKEKLNNYIVLIKNPIVILYFFGIFSYVGLEQGVANWISKFLEIYHSLDPQNMGAKIISYFWGLMTLGTFSGLFLLKKIDSRKILIFFTSASIISLLMSLFGPLKVSLFSFPLIGFFISTMWSIIISLALNSMSKNHGAFSGILVSGIIGGAVFPLIIGILADFAGLKVGMTLLLIPLLFILSIGFWSRPLVNNK